MSKDIKNAVKSLVGDSLARKRAAQNELQSINTIMEAVKEDWTTIISSISMCADSEFQNPSPSGVLSSVAAKISEAIRTWNDLIDLKKSENNNLKEVGIMAADAVGYLSSLRAQILARKFRSKVELAQRFKDIISVMNSRLNEKIQKEIKLDSLELAA